MSVIFHLVFLNPSIKLYYMTNQLFSIFDLIAIVVIDNKYFQALVEKYRQHNILCTLLIHYHAMVIVLFTNIII
jgi:hypothetical protein